MFTATLEDEEVSSDQTDLANTDSAATASDQHKHRGFASVVQILLDDVIKPSNQLED